MTTTTDPREIDPQISNSSRAFGRLRRQAASVWQKSKGWGHSPRLRIPLRLPLLVGSVLVLLTLYLPTAMGFLFGPVPGMDFFSRAETASWAGFLLVFSDGGRTFYLLSLALAAVTPLLLIATVFGWNLSSKHSLLTWLLAISGSVALLATTDSLPWAAIGQLYFWGLNESLGLLALNVLFCLLPIACLRSKFWTWKGAIFWGLISVSVVLGFFFANVLLGEFLPNFEIDEFFTVVLPPTPFLLLPFGLWVRYELLGTTPSSHWPNVAHGLAIFYTLTVVFDIVTAALFEFWGLIAFFLGAYLILYGYWQLRREADARPLVVSIPDADAAT
ncbi:MAG TPA: hypothetical protein VNM47_05925 [Terriglobia bacterium]|nr:hypothetical protein [Terriglobia bacterium]